MPKRVAEFLRSVIPADPFQLLFLAGVVCLVVAHGLRWWHGIGPFAALGVLPIIFAGAAGYFICFWPGNHPVRRILGLVLLPTITGLGLMFGAFAYLNGPTKAGLLSERRRGTSRLYSIRSKGFAQLRNLLDTFWEDGLAKLKSEAEKHSRSKVGR